MNVLFFGSKLEWSAIKPYLKAKYAATAKQCAAILAEDEWNILFLPSSQEIVDWIVENEPIIRNIIIHSEDFPSADAMAKQLRKARYKVSKVPMPTLLQNLRND